MIERMLEVDLVCLVSDQERALKELRELEIMHLTAESRAMESERLAHQRKHLEELDEAIRALVARQANKDEFDYSEQTLSLKPDAMSQRVFQLTIQLERKREEYEHWRRAEENLKPWGDFDPELIEQLRESGMSVLFCEAQEAQVPMPPEGAILRIISSERGLVNYIVISDRQLDPNAWPTVQVPLDVSMQDIQEKMAKARDAVAAAERELRRLSIFLPSVEREAELVREEVEFLEAHDSMGTEGALAMVHAFVPAKHEAGLRNAAHINGWALQLHDADPEDPRVPTLVTVPRWLDIAKPIFDFVGIRPGYDEFDISAWFLVFLTIFFAMIFGDAGYGTLFLAGAVVARIKFGAKFRTQLNLVIVFSIATIVWGVVTGSYFGLAPNLGVTTPALFDWFNAPEDLKNERIMFICFLLGAVHLSIAHAWKALLVINSVRAISQVGWLLFVWANFLLAALMVAPNGGPNVDGAPFVMPGSALITMYVVAVLLVVAFSNPSRNALSGIGKGVGEVLGNSVNSFVDVVSYIRLFAVGLSSFYVANSFNLIAVEQVGFNGVAAVGAILIILFGHTLNIALCLLGVLVHGIRLNTLEFSGHMGLEWKGIPFRPFARRLKDKIVQS